MHTSRGAHVAALTAQAGRRAPDPHVFDNRDTPLIYGESEREARLTDNTSNTNYNENIEFDDYFDSDEYIEKVATILASVGAERLPPLNDWDTLAHLSYRNLNLTEVEISVGDYTGFSDDSFDDNEDDEDGGKEPDARNEFLVEVGAILRFGNELPGSESDEQSLMVLDQQVEPLRKLITAPAIIEVSEQDNFNAWYILPLTAAQIDDESVAKTLEEFVQTAAVLAEALKNDN